MDYEHWVRKCDSIVVANVGVSLHDLPDALWKDYYEEKFNPHEAVELAIGDAWYAEPKVRVLYGNKF